MTDLWELRIGDVIETGDGGAVEVLMPTEDGEWVVGRYLRAGDAGLYGTTELVHASEVSMVRAARN